MFKAKSYLWSTPPWEKLTRSFPFWLSTWSGTFGVTTKLNWNPLLGLESRNLSKNGSRRRNDVDRKNSLRRRKLSWPSNGCVSCTGLDRPESLRIETTWEEEERSRPTMGGEVRCFVPDRSPEPTTLLTTNKRELRKDFTVRLVGPSQRQIWTGCLCERFLVTERKRLIKQTKDGFKLPKKTYRLSGNNTEFQPLPWHYRLG